MGGGGGRLNGGAFLSPELSFDGQTIYFAYSECQATATYQWGEHDQLSHLSMQRRRFGICVQLTEGPADDFDPCVLPNGRIVFVSERRGGYLRCGRHCPVYTLHSMEADGSDVICISFHETHEWNPSVNNDGMLVYTRWDYVDRDTNIAHHLWTCYPDGRDPRSFHGNYPRRRESRPWMEMNIRAIPGSNKYVFSAGAHHGHEFGSLCLLDPTVRRTTARCHSSYAVDTRGAVPRGGNAAEQDRRRHDLRYTLAVERRRLPLCLWGGCQGSGDLLDRRRWQPRVDLPQTRHWLRLPDSAAAAASPTGGSQPDTRRRHATGRQPRMRIFRQRLRC